MYVMYIQNMYVFLKYVCICKICMYIFLYICMYVCFYLFDYIHIGGSIPQPSLSLEIGIQWDLTLSEGVVNYLTGARKMRVTYYVIVVFKK